MRWIVLVVLMASFPFGAHAQTEAPPHAQLMDAVMVSGEQPGPGLWRVSKDDKHVLYILGTLSPLPKKMTWLSREVEGIVAESQELLYEPGVQVKVERNIFRILLLVPAALGVRNNPEGQKLVDVLPPELHARWLLLKQKYIGRSRAVERRRPILAAQKLYSEAMDDAGLEESSLIAPVVAKAAKKNKLTITRPSIAITLEHPRAMLKDLSKTSLDDVACFGKTLDHLESDIGTMKARANAWATGDIESLRALPITDPGSACIAALLDAPVLQAQGFGDARERGRKLWLDAAEAALAKNASTFAMLPMRDLLPEGGYLAALRERGYEIEEP
jgi:uncharacterized protein YbaP (TraB family)